MKFMKKPVFNFVPPATGHAAASISPFSVLARLETLLDTAVLGISTIIRKASTINPALTKKTSAVSISLIKASTPVFDKRDAHLAGRSVLCVGGKECLYPAYRQIVEDAGGHFLSFHGRVDTPLSELHELLKVTDMIIFPVDCIRHEAFFVTKYYCDRFRKPCVMLDKSRVTTFYNGIRMLKNLQ